MKARFQLESVTTPPERVSTGLGLLWLSFGLRLVLGGVLLVAGALKVNDLAGSVRAVRAYQLLPETAAQLVGAGLPVAEIALGALLLAGLGVRVAAVFSAVLLAVFVVGIGSAWARGLRIDCGCFGGGGELAAGQPPRYGQELVRDAGLLLGAVWLAWRPASRYAVDNLGTRTKGETST
jgi:uncharacterized membrane protein YphA (DoxX/SURF4 family)